MENQEYIWYQISYNNKVYLLSFYDVISCLFFATNYALIPKLDNKWISDLKEKYQYVFLDVDTTPKENNQIFLKENVNLYDIPNDSGEFCYFISAKENIMIGLHDILKMVNISEKEGILPQLGYTDFWQFVPDIYYNYFKREGYHNVICTDLKQV